MASRRALRSAQCHSSGVSSTVTSDFSCSSASSGQRPSELAVSGTDSSAWRGGQTPVKARRRGVKGEGTLALKVLKMREKLEPVDLFDHKAQRELALHKGVVR